MVKHLLSIAAAAALSASASAEVVTLWTGECDFGTAWASSASFAIPASDLSVLGNESAELTLEYTLDANETYWQIKPVSNGDGWTPLKVAEELGNSYNCITMTAGSTSYKLPLGAEDLATIKADGIRFQGYGMTVTKVTAETDKVIDPNVLWEGELTFSSWSVNGANVSASKVKAGDVLKYTISEPGSGDNQLLIKGSDWGNLLGTCKISSADLAKGSVTVGVTQAMIDNCGGQFFLQGNGGPTVTKIEKAGTFDATNVLAYGERECGSNVFITIPETATALEVTFTKAPGWSQLCNTSWTDFKAASTSKTNADGTVTVTFTLTADIISAVNAKKEVIVNSDTPILMVALPGATQGIADIEADEDAPVVYYNLQGVQVENPESGLYIRRQGKTVTKVLIK